MAERSVPDSGGHHRLPKFIGVDQAARDRGVSAITLYREIAEGRLPALRLGTRLVIPVVDDEDTTRAGDTALSSRRPRNVSVPEAARARVASHGALP